MTKFLSDRLDLSRLQSVDPSVFQDLDYEAMVAARLVDFKRRWPAWDQGALETDPAVILQQVDAYRELLDLQAINTGFRAILPAYATDADLDHIALRAGVVRQDGELDDDLRMRYFASFGAPAAGSEDGYTYAALTAVPTLRDVAIVGPDINGTPGQVDVVLLEGGGVAVPSRQVVAVTSAVNAKNARPLTDMVNVDQATIVNYSVAMTVYIPRGPDPAAARTTVLSLLAAIVAERYHIGGRVPTGSLEAAGYVAGATLVVVSSPPSDIPSDPYSAPWCTGVSVSVVVRD